MYNAISLNFVYIYCVYLIYISVFVCPRYAHVSILVVRVYNNHQINEIFYFLCKQQQNAYIISRKILYNVHCTVTSSST